MSLYYSSAAAKNAAAASSAARTERASTSGESAMDTRTAETAPTRPTAVSAGLPIFLYVVLVALVVHFALIINTTTTNHRHSLFGIFPSTMPSRVASPKDEVLLIRGRTRPWQRNLTLFSLYKSATVFCAAALVRLLLPPHLSIIIFFFLLSRRMLLLLLGPLLSGFTSIFFFVFAAKTPVAFVSA